MTAAEQLDLREEMMNGYTHGLGILFGLVSMPILMVRAIDDGSSASITGAVVYGLSFLLLFTASTLFHIKGSGKLRERLKILDHISIYFLIAGTYTPFILIFVNNHFGHILLIILWSLTLFGSVFKLFFTGKFEWLSTLIYIGMGWMLVVGTDKFFSHMPDSIIILIICGAGLYMVGVIFYIWRLFAYHHAVWHLFVLAGAICHYSAILSAV